MNKILSVLLAVALVFGSHIKVADDISDSNIDNIPNTVEETTIDSDSDITPNYEDELRPFIGKWVTTKLSVTPRVALVERNYAKAHSDMVGKELIISDDCVTFEGENFYGRELEICDDIQLSSLYNIIPGEASMICCGQWDGTHMAGVYPVKDISLYTHGDTNVIGLIIRPNNTLMLWLGERYYYVGFYELAQIS